MRHATRPRLIAIFGALVIVAGCGGGGATAGPTSGAQDVDPRPTAAGATTAPGSTPARTAPGAARATVRIGDAETVISGGQCGVNEFPPDFGGGHGFYTNIGVMNFEDGGPDYLGLLIGEVPGPGTEADGTYESTWNNAAGTLVAGGKYTPLGDIVLTVKDGGMSGTLTSVVRNEDTPVEIAFTC